MNRDREIVFREAFKVVKDDYLSRLDHNPRGSLDSALGVANHFNDETFVRVEHVIKSNDTISGCMSFLLHDSTNLNEFIADVLIIDDFMNAPNKKECKEFELKTSPTNIPSERLEQLINILSAELQKRKR